MTDIVNPGNQPQQSLEDFCNIKSPLQQDLNCDPPPKDCPDPLADPSLRDIPPDFGWLEDCTSKTGIGHEAQCDSMQTGQIVNTGSTNRNVVYRYSKALRGHDEAMLDLFSNLVVIDDDGKAHPVPIVFAPQERAVEAILSDAVRKDTSLVVDRLKLPIISLWSSDIQYDPARYTYHKATLPGFAINENGFEKSTMFGVTRGIPVNISYALNFWTQYLEDMRQIQEQMFTKFSSVAYLRVRGVWWEIIVKLDSTANNINVDAGNDLSVKKYQFNLTVETYIPQPIRRDKAVLGIRASMFNGLDSSKVDDVIGRIEIAAKGFEL